MTFLFNGEILPEILLVFNLFLLPAPLLIIPRRFAPGIVRPTNFNALRF